MTLKVENRIYKEKLCTEITEYIINQKKTEKKMGKKVKQSC